MGRVIARDRRGRDEGKRNGDAQPERPQDGEEQLADAENQPGRNQADRYAARPAGAGVIGPYAGGDAREGRKRVERASVNSSQQRTPMAAMLKMMPRKIMVVVSVRKGLTVAPSTTTTAQREA